MQKNVFPVSFFSNKKNIPYTAVSIQSIIDYACANKAYKIYVFHSDLSQSDEQRIHSLSDKANVSICCIRLLPEILLKNGKNLFAQNKIINYDAYYRFFVPELLADYPKVLYLDSDVILQDDISKIFESDLNGSVVGGCHNLMIDSSAAGLYIEEKLDLEKENYIDDGVLLFNVAEWQKEKRTEKIFQLLDSDKTPQDVLNVACRNQLTLLPPQWDCLQGNLFEQDNFIWYENIYKNAHLIHYAGLLKPWNRTDLELSELWWKYARKTPFYENILQKDVINVRLQTSENKSDIQRKMQHKIKTNPQISALILEYVKERFLGFFCLGESRKKHTEKKLFLESEIIKQMTE